MKKLYERLGSVREIININGSDVKQYTYSPFGQTIEESSDEPLSTSNCFMFTGQYFDSEIDQYYLRARQYDPHIARFTARDPVFGKFQEPMTLHRYLYCIDDPINKTDPSGESVLDYVANVVYGISAYYTGLDEGLKAAGGDWEGILDVAIAANTWRETYFAPENLSKPFFDSGSFIQGALLDKIANACDWGPLVGCVAKDYLEGLKYEAPLVMIGEISCAVCATSFEPVSKTGFCMGCALYKYSNPARIAANIINVADCVSKNCNW